MNINIQCGDILGYGGGSWISKAIKWAERGYRENHSVISHCGLFVNRFDNIGTLKNVNIVEALFPKGVTYRKFWDAYKDDLRHCYILKPVELNDSERLRICNYAINCIGKPYGTLKLIPHLADGILAKIIHRRDFACFRKLCRLDAFPICSYLVAKAFKEVGLDFGVSASVATPDDIFDFALSHPHKYQIIELSQVI